MIRVQSYRTQFADLKEEFIYFLLSSAEQRNIALGNLNFIIKMIEYLQMASYTSFNLSQLTIVTTSEFYRAPMLFSRPTQLFTNFRLGYLSYPLSIFTILFLTLMMIVPVLSYLNRKKKNQSQVFKDLSQLYFSFLPLFSPSLLILFLDCLNLIGIAGTGFDVTSQSIPFGYRIVCNFYLVILILFSLVILYYFQIKYQLINQNTERNDINLEHILTHILKIVISIISTISKTNPENQSDRSYHIILGIGVALWYLLQCIDIVRNIPFSNFSLQIQTASFCASFFIFSLSAPFYYINNLIDGEFFITINILIIPVVYALMKRSMEKKILELMFQRVDVTKGTLNEQFSLFYWKVNLLFNNREAIINDFSIQISSEIDLHRRKCTKAQCICRSIEAKAKDTSALNDLKLNSSTSSFSVQFDHFKTYLILLTGQAIDRFQNIKIDRNHDDIDKYTMIVVYLLDFIIMTKDFNRGYDFVFEMSQKINLTQVQQASMIDSKVEVSFNEHIRYILLRICENKIRTSYKTYFKMLSKNLSCAQTSADIDIFIRTQEDNFDIFDALSILLQDKLDFLEKMLEGFARIDELENRNRRYYIKLVAAKKIIEEFFNNYQTFETKAFLQFFYSQISNDFLDAQKISSIYLQKQFRQIAFEVFDRKSCQLVTSVGHIPGLILSYSQHFPRWLGFDEFQFREIKSINDIIISPVSEFHHLLVNQTPNEDQGVNFFQTPVILFFQNQQNLLVPFQVFIEFTHLYQQQLNYIVFARKIKYSARLLTIDSQNKLRGVDQNFMAMLFDNIDENETYIQRNFSLPVTDLIPTWDDCLDNFQREEKKKRDTVRLTQVKIRMPNRDSSMMVDQQSFHSNSQFSDMFNRSQSKTNSKSTNYSGKEQNKNTIWNLIFTIFYLFFYIFNDPCLLNRIIADIDITRIDLLNKQEYVFYKLEIKNFTESNNSNANGSSLSKTGTNLSENQNKSNANEQEEKVMNELSVIDNIRKENESNIYEQQQIGPINITSRSVFFTETNRILTTTPMVKAMDKSNINLTSHENQMNTQNLITRNDQVYRYQFQQSKPTDNSELIKAGRDVLFDRIQIDTVNDNNTNKKDKKMVFNADMSFNYGSGASKSHDMSLDMVQKDLQQRSFEREMNETNNQKDEPRYVMNMNLAPNYPERDKNLSTPEEKSREEIEKLEQVKLNDEKDNERSFQSDGFVSNQKKNNRDSGIQNDQQQMNDKSDPAQKNNNAFESSSGYSQNSYTVRKQLQIYSSISTNKNITSNIMKNLLLRNFTLFMLIFFCTFTTIFFNIKFQSIQPSLDLITLSADSLSDSQMFQIITNELIYYAIQVRSGRASIAKTDFQERSFRNRKDYIQDEYKRKFNINYNNPFIRGQFTDKIIYLVNLYDFSRERIAYSLQSSVQQTFISMESYDSKDIKYILLLNFFLNFPLSLLPPSPSSILIVYNSTNILDRLKDPQIMFFKQNLINSYQFYQQLNDNLLNKIQNFSNETLAAFNILIIVDMIICTVFVVLNFTFTTLHIQEIQKIFKYLKIIKNQHLLNELSRVQKLKQILEKNRFFHEYRYFKFNFSDKEHSLKNGENKNETEMVVSLANNNHNANHTQSLQKKKLKYKRIEIFNHESLSLINQSLLIIGFFLLFFVFSLYMGLTADNFYTDFKQTSKTLNQVTWTSTIPSILGNCDFELRMNLNELWPTELQYTNSEIDQIISMVRQEMIAISQFFQMYQSVRNDQMVQRQGSSVNVLFQEHDLTQQCDGEIALCTRLFNGVLKKGVIKPMTKLRSLYQDLVDKKFDQLQPNISYFIRATIQQLQLIAKVIKGVIDLDTEYEGNIILIVGLSFAGVFLIALFLYYFFGSQYQERRFFYSKKIIHIVPQYTLLIDETFLKIMVSCKTHLGINN